MVTCVKITWTYIRIRIIFIYLISINNIIKLHRTGSEAQVKALRAGLGLDSPDEEFWKPLSACTSSMPPKEKILLLSELIPEFGRNLKLGFVPDAFNNILTTLRAKAPEIAESDIQIFAGDLIIHDFLHHNGEAVSDIARLMKYLSFIDSKALIDMINERVSVALK